MYSYLKFNEYVLLESKNEKVHHLEHPVKGKYTLHKNGDYHHVKNEFGEVTHTFYKLHTNHVLGKLKLDHDIHHKTSKLNEDFIFEMANEASEINSHRGGFNEAMFAYHMNGQKWIDEDHKKAAFHHKSKLDSYDQTEARRQNDRAMAQAKSFSEHAKKNGYSGVKAVHITAKPGDIEKKTGIKATQQENPSDVIVHFKKKPQEAEHGYYGCSLKSSSAKKIGFHNGGADTISKDLGLDIEGHHKKRWNEFMKKNNLSGSFAQIEKTVKGKKYLDDSKKIRNPKYRDNPLFHKASEHRQIIDNEVRDKLHSHMSKMEHNDVKKHLLSTYVKASTNHALPYVKTHGTGGHEKEASAHTEDPSDNEMYHKIKKSKRIHFQKSGSGNISVHADGQKVFNIQVKHNNGPFTSMKFLGQP